jgi:ABC-type sugar transport system permease subunit
MKPRAALFLLAPATAMFIFTFVAPILMAGRLSFVGPEGFVGFANYTAALRDRYFQRSFLNSFIMVAMAGIPQVIVAYLAASFFQRFGRRTQAAARFAVYVPGLAAGVVMGLLYEWILQREGLLNGLLAMAGIGAVPWLTDIWPARISLAFIVMTGCIGGLTIMFSASMSQIPRELHDAATIDGASDRQYRALIVRPLMTPTIMLMLMLAIVGMMQIWETIYILWSEGGPEGGIASPVYEVFLTAFQFGKRSLSMAKGFILTLVIGAILIVKSRVERWMK